MQLYENLQEVVHVLEFHFLPTNILKTHHEVNPECEEKEKKAVGFNKQHKIISIDRVSALDTEQQPQRTCQMPFGGHFKPK